MLVKYLQTLEQHFIIIFFSSKVFFVSAVLFIYLFKKIIIKFPFYNKIVYVFNPKFKTMKVLH